MKSKLLYIFGGLFVLGGVLFGVGSLLPGTAPAEADLASLSKLEPFTSIRLDVKSADVSILYGESYSIGYNLHGREPVKTLEVQNGTLIFDTGFSHRWMGGDGDWSVTIIVPEGTVFDTVELESTAGDIRLNNLTAADLTVKTTSGEIELEAITCDNLTAKSVSDDIELENSQIALSAKLDTVSGDIFAEGRFGAVWAKSIGGVKLNGADQGRKLSIGTGTPALSAESVSGEIEIDNF